VSPRVSPGAWRALLLLFLVLVTWLALVPKPPPVADTGWDKMNHVLAFAALGLSAWFGFGQTRLRAVMALLALLAYGGLIEVLQAQLPPRSAEWGDLLADAVGLTAGALLALVLQMLAAHAAGRLNRPR